MSEFALCAYRSDNAQALSLQFLQGADLKHLSIIGQDPTPPLRHHRPCKLFEAIKAKRLSVRFLGAFEHRSVKRDAIDRQRGALRFVVGEISEQAQIIARDDN